MQLHRTREHFLSQIQDILAKRSFAVVGASRDQSKFGYQVYKTLKAAGYNTFAVNPNATDIDGDPVYPVLDNVPEKLDCAVTVVHPEVTFEVCRQCGHLDIPFIWMQPGSESESAVEEAYANSVYPIYGGPCIMVEIANRQEELLAEEDSPGAL